MKTGFIYPLVNSFVRFLFKINLVEYFVAGLLVLQKPQTLEEKVAATRVAVDIYIVVKWAIVVLFWFLDLSGCFVRIVTWYLVASNVFTYFYYHVWSDSEGRLMPLRMKRRFVNLIQAFAYSNLCFAYLYCVPYRDCFRWGKDGYLGSASVAKSILYSLSNSVVGNYDVVSPVLTSDVGAIIVTLQVVVSFLMLTIILSKSIPGSSIE